MVDDETKREGNEKEEAAADATTAALESILDYNYEEPGSDDILDCSAEEEDILMDFDDEWAIQGGSRHGSPGSHRHRGGDNS